MVHSVLRRAVDVRRDEVHALAMAFTYFFFALASWFVLRPIRDAVAASSGAAQLSWLFVGTLSLTLVANPLLSALVVRFPPRKFIPYAYHIIVVSLLLFYVLLRTVGAAEGSTADIWIGRAFFIWLSVFVLFVTSLFWCFMADVFKSEQAKRLFGFIGVGGTLGSIAGSALTVELAPRICAAASLPHLHPERRRILLQSISEAAATAPGWSTREPAFYPEWVDKIEPWALPN